MLPCILSWARSITGLQMQYSQGRIWIQPTCRSGTCSNAPCTCRARPTTNSCSRPAHTSGSGAPGQQRVVAAEEQGSSCGRASIAATAEAPARCMSCTRSYSGGRNECKHCRMGGISTQRQLKQADIANILQWNKYGFTRCMRMTQPSTCWTEVLRGRPYCWQVCRWSRPSGQQSGSAPA
jgi:hypothetical protein